MAFGDGPQEIKLKRGSYDEQILDERLDGKKCGVVQGFEIHGSVNRAGGVVKVFADGHFNLGASFFGDAELWPEPFVYRGAVIHRDECFKVCAFHGARFGSLRDLKGIGSLACCRSGGWAEMFLVLAKQKLVGHSGDVIAYDDVAGFRAGRLFMRSGHGTRRIEVIEKELLEAADGTVAVFGDGGVIVDVLEEEAFQFRVALGKRIAETSKPAWGAANVVHGCGSGSEHALLRGRDEICDQVIQNEPECCVELQLFAPVWISGFDLSVRIGEDWNFTPQNIEIKKLRFARVVEVGGVVGDFIDPVDELTFERGSKIEKILSKIWKLRSRVIVGVLDDAFADFEGKIQAGEIEVWAFELFNDAECLEIVIEARAAGTHEFVEFLFAGVAERGMADIVDKSERLGKVRVEAEGRGNCASDLRNFQSVGEPIAKVIGVTNGEHLRLGFEAAEGTRMNDAVAVARVFGTVRMRWFRVAASA